MGRQYASLDCALDFVPELHLFPTRASFVFGPVLAFGVRFIFPRFIS